MIHFTEEQARLLDQLHRHRRLAIPGCTGSGKTLLAVEQATRLDRQGLKVLLLCRNPYLAETLRTRVQGTQITISDFPAFVQAMIQSAEKPDLLLPRLRSKFGRPWTPFDLPTERELNWVYDRLIRLPERFEAVIVDEAQDFPPGWWVVVEACLNEPNVGSLYVFYDDNQDVYPFSSFFINLIPQAPLALSLNLRNGGEIYQLVRQLYPLEAGMRAGTAVEGTVREWHYASEIDLLEQLAKALLAAEEALPGLKEVVILTAESAPAQQSKVKGMLVDSPRLHAIKEKGCLDWQKAVLRYLQPYGLEENALSNQPLPTRADLKAISEFCRRMIEWRHILPRYRDRRYTAKPTLHWSMDWFGELRLHRQEGASAGLSDSELLTFFKDESWPKSLPASHPRYRLTPLAEMAQHPQAHNIPLVDIPSFKGLEAQGVVFLFTGYFASYEDELNAIQYEAFSRARRLLHIVSPYGTTERGAAH